MEKRQDFLDELRAEATEDARSELAANRKNTWQRLDEILEKAMTRLADESLRVRSFEGLLHALIDMLRLRMDLRDSVRRGLDRREPLATMPVIPLRATDDELRMAWEVVQARRRARSQAAADGTAPTQP